MMRTKAALIASAATLVLVAAACESGTQNDAGQNDGGATPTATAGGGSGLRAQLQALNNSGAQGEARVEIDGMSLNVTLEASGVSAGVPHALHIHIGGENRCPGTDVAGEDGLINTAEGVPAYGSVRVSMTESGDTSASSALAVDRFTTAADGQIRYSRTFDMPAGVTVEDIRQGVVVVHGIASISGDKAKYDGEAKSSLDPSLPLEATIPALCGKLQQA